MTPQQMLPPDHAAYRRIRTICRSLGGVVDEVTFHPLDNGHGKVLSVQAVIPHRPDLWITLWYGHRDGRGKDGSAEGFWVRAGDHDSMGAVPAAPLDPLRPGAGLTYPAELEGKVRKTIRRLHEILTIADETHRGLGASDRILNLQQINDAAEDGMAEYMHAGKIDDDPVHLLRTLCEESRLRSIEFSDLMGGAVPDSFTTQTQILFDDGPRVLAVWFEPADDGHGDVPWLRVGGWFQRLPRKGTADPAVMWPEKHGDLISETCDLLLEIHELAVSVYEDVTTGGPEGAFSLLSAVAQSATAEDPEDRAHEGRAWHTAVDEFTRLCRLGLFGGVVVDESPYGSLNVQADTFDPITDQPVRPQAYWEQAADAAPVHWLAVGTATHPAHPADGGDLMRTELLSGFPQDSRYHLRHAIDHLHEMVHVAADVVNAKVAELAGMLQELEKEGSVSEVVAGQMKADAVEDALAGLNGIGRLYTGALERNVRNS